MRLVAIENVKPQGSLARSVYGNDGKMILIKGTLLNEHYIQRLKDLGIASIYVDDAIASLEVDEFVSEETRLSVVRISREALPRIRAGESLESRKLRSLIHDILDEIMLNKELMLHLIAIRSLRDHTFPHSVNVCILSLLTGVTMGYNRLKLIELGSAALLHDVGKAMVFDRIVNNNDVLADNEYQIIKKHVNYGFETLSKSKDFGSLAASVAWEHHERFDGTGYPRGIEGETITEYARIVGIADVFEALSSDRPYRDRLLPHEVLGNIQDSKGIEFDPDITVEFIRSIVPYSLGSMVKLNSGCRGIVVSLKQEFPTRPRIQLLCDDQGQEINGIYVVDLIRDMNTYIVELIKK